MRLFIFPHAGGNAYSYISFRSWLPKLLTLELLELPGRGKKTKEKLIYDAEEAADSLFAEIKDRLDEPYAIFGHSMGSLLSYLVIKRIVAANLAPPIKFFSSSAMAPSMIRNNKSLMLDSDKFWEMIIEIGGVQNSLLLDDQVRDMFEPILRADFQALETYKYRYTDKLTVPIVVFLADEDKVSLEECLTWQDETTEDIKIYQFKGNHFYILKHNVHLIDAILLELKPLNHCDPWEINS
ncbi:thioesterase II family protein [Puia dinghuensis]|uniref:Thioesterase n=1 Tax=Puia dinghuensis TaxID=1792502 RepID=A0A8J2UBZ1_9BACT|nr:thioesterase domain-containing protein [Puia dinghuensis]GGA93565.1 thioesterase [Puia dinghuensis]